MNPEQFTGPARTIALDVAREHQIFLDPIALEAVDTLVQERLPALNARFEEGSLDLVAWQKTVRALAQRVAVEAQADGVRSLKEPEDILTRVRPMLGVFPFDC
jgi:hypothetical protein